MAIRQICRFSIRTNTRWLSAVLASIEWRTGTCRNVGVERLLDLMMQPSAVLPVGALRGQRGPLD